jgi:drug/metabolite transporter (DMT)-like permease
MHRAAYLLLLLTALFWAGNAVAGKFAIGHVSPMMLTLLRWGLATLVLVLFGLPRLVVDWPVIRRNLPFLAALGAIGFTAFNVALYTALLYTSAVNVSIEQAAIPMLIFFGNFLLFRVKPAAAQIAGFVLSVGGVVLTAGHGEFARVIQLEINFGDALMLVAIIGYAVYTIALRYKPDIHWLSLIIVLCAAATLSSIPFALAEWLAGAAILPDVTGWAVILYTVLFPSIIAQLFYIKGVQLIGPNRAGMFINLVPVFGALLSIGLLSEAFHSYHAIALAMVLGGIWLSELGGRKAHR